MIESGYFWNNIFFLAVGTIAIRGSIIAVSAKINISNRWREIFSYIPAAILPAFVAPAAFFHQGRVAIAHGKERFFILLLATGVCYLTRSTLATIVFGLLSLYLATSYL
jgi:branched-subunit amino acid transport protein